MATQTKDVFTCRLESAWRRRKSQRGRSRRADAFSRLEREARVEVLAQLADNELRRELD